MDPILYELAQKCALIAILIIAVRWLVGEMKALQDKRNGEVIAERARCEATIDKLAGRVTTLEDRANADNNAREHRILSVAEQSTAALRMIAERLPSPTPLGNPIIPPSDHRT